MTNAEFAILSLIFEQPRHGYEIEQVLEARGMREWTAVGFSSIYYLLKKLEEGGLVEAQVKPVGRGASRRVYSITDAGRAVYHRQLLIMLSTPQTSPPPFLLGLANWPGVTPAEGVAAIRQYRAALAERLAQMNDRWDQQRPLPFFVDATFSYGRALLEAELAWIDRFLQQQIQIPAEDAP